MPQGNPRPGERYLHFKQKLYQVITTAQHSETGEKLVIYQALYGDYQTYARPVEMFISPVDREKYPQVQQKYRFQLVESQTDSNIAQQKDDSTGESITHKTSAEEKLMAFFDARTMEEKYQILLDMRDEINDHMINNMAVVLDVVIEEGPLDQRYEELKTCVRTFKRYESSRLR